MSERLLQRWRALAGGDADEIGAALLLAYAEPQRRYHTQSHIAWLLDEAERHAAVIRDSALIGYTIWFHDAIYVPGEGNNEAESAAWAERALAGRGDLGARVGKLIRMTKKHAEGEADADEALFLDMDMAIVGVGWDEYRVYAAGIRAEFADVPDPGFAAGRGSWLTAQLERPRIFRTDLYESELGAQARANMAWEAQEMRFGRTVRV